MSYNQKELLNPPSDKAVSGPNLMLPKVRKGMSGMLWGLKNFSVSSRDVGGVLTAPTF